MSFFFCNDWFQKIFWYQFLKYFNTLYFNFNIIPYTKNINKKFPKEIYGLLIETASK
jgi:hypothetical protein